MVLESTGGERTSINYVRNDAKLPENLRNHIFGYFAQNKFAIKKVIFNKPATIVFWADGTKTVVKCADFDIFDPEKGLAMAICKRVYGEEFHKIFKDYMPEEDEESEYPNGSKLTTGYADWINALKNITITFDTNTKEDK